MMSKMTDYTSISVSAPLVAAFANLDLQDGAPNSEATSPAPMAVDAPEEHVIEPNQTESEQVAIISPDSMETDTPLLASDCMPSSPPPSSGFIEYERLKPTPR
jgi:hypothetical protein